MVGNSKNGLLDKFFLMPRFAPAIFAAFLGSFSMLFLRELGQNAKQFLSPALFVYAQGAAILGTIHRLLGAHYERRANYEKNGYLNNEAPIPVGWKIFLLIAHFGWFLSLILYIFWRNIL